MIHCGSRGLGHQVCSDYIRIMEEEDPKLADSLVDRNLIYAPSTSEVSKKYFKAMCAAANFAWANRHIIAHHVRQSFKEIFPESEVNAIYDIAHNICKMEEHKIDGQKKKVYVHRKGATRAFPPGNIVIPEKYREFGQPILLPGSMGTASYILVGGERSMDISFGSTAHGAGRVMSRRKAKELFRGETVKAELEKQEIYVKAASWKGISEEAPGVYKDVDEVVKISDSVGIGKIVVKLRPLGVVKG
jgi:tRNA-splicing ligase RtcB (3'-phosphate/5'-hydroxy nucleic acid ligase)